MKKKRKNKRLNCGPTSKQCGGVCIEKSDTCHKGKAALLKNNVKKDISRLENGGDFGKVSEKAFAKILVQDKEIGQKMPASFGAIVANSEKLDDRVKKAYIDSATFPKWNLRGTDGDVKLKKDDDAFKRKIESRRMKNNIVSTGKKRDEKKARKGFFKTEGGKNVLKALAGAAVVGGIAAATIYSAQKKEDQKLYNVEEGENKATTVSKQKYPDNTSRTEAQAEAFVRTGESKLGKKIANEKFYDNPKTSYESYTDTYQRAKSLNSLRKSGNLSDRKEKDFTSMWGFASGDAEKHIVDGKMNPLPESTLGLARKRVIDDLNSQGFTTDAEHKQVLMYHENPSNWENIRKTGKKYNKETNRYEVQKWTDQIDKEYPKPGRVADPDRAPDMTGVKDASYQNVIALDQDSTNVLKMKPGDRYDSHKQMVEVNAGYEIKSDPSVRRKGDNPQLKGKGVNSPTVERQTADEIERWDARDPEIRAAREEIERLRIREEEASPFGMMQDELQIARGSFEKQKADAIALATDDLSNYQVIGKGRRKGWEQPEGASTADEEWAQKNDNEAKKQPGFLSESANLQLSDDQKNEQRDRWRKMSDADQNAYNDIDILRQISPRDDFASYWNTEHHVFAIQTLNEKIRDPRQLDLIRKGNLKRMQNDVVDGKAVLPEYKQIAEESELGQSAGGKYSDSTGGEETEAGGIENVGSTSGDGYIRKYGSKGMKKKVLEERKFINKYDTKQGEKPPWDDKGRITDNSGRKMRRRKNKKGGYNYMWDGEIVPKTVNNDAAFIRWLKEGGKWDFAEELMEEYVQEIIEEKNGIIVCITDEGVIAYDFNNRNNYTKVYL